MNRLRPPLRLVLGLFVLALFPACGRHEHAAAKTPAGAAGHEHRAPHGGTALMLGNEAHHLELVAGTPGRLTAYVLDGEMEKFIRVAAPSFEVTAMVDGAARPLVFRAVASNATGETVGNTSQFVAEADWLSTAPTFDGVLTRLEVRGAVYANVAFNFPKGNEP